MAVIEIRIELKKGVADPEGKNIKKALEALGFEGVGEVKTVKVYDIEIEGTDEEAVSEGEEMCKKLLANPVIQNFKVTVR
ncbi:MAG: phosphoribosylformylglycinamidine synthase subunit PurS [Candidatus Methanomethylophilaceae archaeon]|jgi:phosphoribosylformylglycinamidine synthase